MTWHTPHLYSWESLLSLMCSNWQQYFKTEFYLRKLVRPMPVPGTRSSVSLIPKPLMMALSTVMRNTVTRLMLFKLSAVGWESSSRLFFYIFFGEYLSHTCVLYVNSTNDHEKYSNYRLKMNHEVFNKTLFLLDIYLLSIYREVKSIKKLTIIFLHWKLFVEKIWLWWRQFLQCHMTETCWYSSQRLKMVWTPPCQDLMDPSTLVSAHSKPSKQSCFYLSLQSEEENRLGTLKGFV